MRKAAWIAAMTLLVFGLGLLVHVQLFGINQLTHAQLEREKNVLAFGARQLAVDLEHDVHQTALSFEGAAPHELPERLAQWRAHARDPHIMKALYIVRGDEELLRADGDLPEAVAWPPELAPIQSAMQHGLRLSSPLVAEIPAVILPLRPMPMRKLAMPPDEAPHLRHPMPMLVIELDRDYLARTYYPDLVHRIGEPYDVLVSDGTRTVYTNAPAWNGTHADATVKFLRFFREDESVPGWTVFLRRRGERVETILSHLRLHYFLINGTVLVLLVTSFVLLAIMAHAAEKQRAQQLELVAGLTHELNTPLAAIRSAGQNLADGVVSDPERVTRYGGIVNREATRLGDLVAQVLDYSGLQSGNAPRRAPVQIAEVVQNAIEQTRWLASEKDVAIEEHVASDLPPIEADGEALTRALQNLIANAIRHGGDGKWAGVRVEREGDSIAFTVEDRGPGIEPRDAKRLFEPFYRGANAKARGTGLGLTIVRQVARAHGGSVSVDRHRANGAAFTMRIPAVPRG